jgi:hypothetical protein
MPRRYKTSENHEYHQEFDRLKGQSKILNPRCVTINDIALEASFQPAQVLAEWLEAAVPKAKAALDAAALEWEKTKVKARRTGRPVPQEEPPRILEQRLRAEAAVDVVNEEVAALRRMTEQRKKADEAVRPEKVLQWGPRGCGFGEPLREIDGQVVVERDGELVISCAQSQYDGLALPVYHSEVVMPYLKACRKARKETGRAVAPWPKRPEA